MITIKDRTLITVLCTHGVISGKQNNESCLVIPGNNDGGIMFVQAGVPVTDLTIVTEGEEYTRNVTLNLYVSGTSLKVFGDEANDESYTFNDDLTFYCDATITVDI